MIDGIKTLTRLNIGLTDHFNDVAAKFLRVTDKVIPGKKNKGFHIGPEKTKFDKEHIVCWIAAATTVSWLKMLVEVSRAQGNLVPTLHSDLLPMCWGDSEREQFYHNCGGDILPTVLTRHRLKRIMIQIRQMIPHGQVVPSSAMEILREQGISLPY